MTIKIPFLLLLGPLNTNIKLGQIHTHKAIHLFRIVCFLKPNPFQTLSNHPAYTGGLQTSKAKHSSPNNPEGVS